MVKNLPSRVRSLGREDPLEKEMATHSSTLVWKIPWTEEPGKLQYMRWQRVRHDLSDLTFTFFPMQGTRVWSLVKKLGPHMPQSN